MAARARTKTKEGSTRMRNSRQRCSTGVGMGGKASESMRLKFRFVFCEHTRDAGDSGDLAEFGEEILDSFGVAQQQAIGEVGAFIAFVGALAGEVSFPAMPIQHPSQVHQLLDGTGPVHIDDDIIAMT